MKHLQNFILVFLLYGLFISVNHFCPDIYAQTEPNPGDLIWHTYQGGNFTNFSEDRGYDIAIDNDGYLYVVGTSGTPWDTQLTPVNPHNPNADAPVIYKKDIFVAKFTREGAMVWHTFLGSPIKWWGQYYLSWTGVDEGTAITIGNNGNIYIAGYSDNTWGEPINPFNKPGNQDAFVAKLNAETGELQWNTFFGSTNRDYGNDITVDIDGNIYIAGESNASWGNPIRTHYGGYGGDAFVVKMNSNGHIIWNTFLGGTNGDNAHGITIDNNYNIFVTGETAFWWTDGTWGGTTPEQLVDPGEGNSDAFVARLNSSGNLVWYAFLGGNDTYSGQQEIGKRIAVDNNNFLYVAGDGWPVWGSPVRNSSGGREPFAVKMNATTGGYIWNTFMGGSMSDEAGDIKVNENGHVFVTGHNRGINYWGDVDAFVTELDESGVRQWYTSLFAERDDQGRYGSTDKGKGIVLSKDGSIYIAGSSTLEWGHPLNEHSGSPCDVLIAKLKAQSMLTDKNPPVIISEDLIKNTDPAVCGSVVEFTVTAQDDVDGPVPVVCDPPSGTTFPKGITTVNCTAVDAAGNIATATFTVTVIDNEAPVITEIADITTGTDPDVSTAKVTYSSTAEDNCDGVVDLIFNPPSGSDFPLGETIVTCTATDEAGNTSTETFKVTVIDDEPPVIKVAHCTNLWPPNHKYVNFTLEDFGIAVTDNVDAQLPVKITKVSSDEPEDEIGKGDGNTKDDMVISKDGASLNLRAEREGTRNGRVYTVYFEATDAAGNVGMGQCIVGVPHDKKDKAIDDGSVYWVYGYSLEKGSVKLTSNTEIPSEFVLYQNYPNPF